MPKPYFSNKQKMIQEIIMVDHAGEYGAQRIYEGQIDYTKDPATKIILKQMLEQELEHLDYFDQQIQSGKSRPTALMPIWDIVGYALGAISASLGVRTAMLVTENVEKIIVEHYQEQIDYLENVDKHNPLLKKIRKFKQDEAEHIHIAIDNESNNAPFYFLASNLIRHICKSAIFLSKKI